MSYLPYILTAAGLVSMVSGVVSLRNGLKSADGFKRLEGMAWCAIEIVITFGCVIMAYLGLNME